MLELALNYGKGPIDLKEIAKKEDISLKYLEQVIVPLKAAGLLKATRGSRGGYSLAKPPSEISLSDVVKVLEGPIELVNCIKDPARCSRSFHCVARDIWKQATEALENVFDSITFEEMAKRMKEKEENAPPMYQI